MEEGHTRTIQIQPTVPIICPISFLQTCHVEFDLMVPDFQSRVNTCGSGKNAPDIVLKTTNCGIRVYGKMFRSLVIASRRLQSLPSLRYARCQPKYYIQPQNMSTVPADVQRALGPLECMAVDLHRNGSFVVASKFSLNSLVTITEDTMRRSLETIQATFPIHRMRVVERESVKYFKKTENEAIDFEFRDELEGVTNFYDEMLASFDEAKGPLWRAKFVKRRPGSSMTHPFAYDIYLSWHHSITDGRSIIRRFQQLLQTLDCIVDGYEPDCSTEMKISPPLEDLLPGRDYKWSEVLPLVKKMLDTDVCTYIKHFPAPGHSKPRTNYILFDPLDENQVMELCRRAKVEGATVHGAFTAAANTAVYNAIRNGENYHGEAIMVSVDHAIDMRRYFAPENRLADGFYVGSLPTETTITQNHVQNFWQLANEITKQLQINSTPEQIIPKSLTTDTCFNAQKHIAEAKKNQHCVYDYGVSNMGDMTPLLSGVYNNFNIDSATTWSAMHHYNMPYFYDVYTLRGKLYVSILSCTDCVTEKQVKQLGESAIEILKHAIQK